MSDRDQENWIQPTGSGDTREKPIKLGGALVTLVEPHRGHEVAYNRWYERDHFYAGCMIGAWCFSGARFVATRDCKAKRLPLDHPLTDGDPTRGSYLAVYWILAGKFGDWIRWGTDQVNWLHANDRMFPHRDHVHTLMYKLTGEVRGEAGDAATGDDGVPVELALDHRYRGLVLQIGEIAEGVEPAEVADWFASRPAPGDVTARFSPIPLLGDAPSDVPRDMAANRFLHLTFTDGDVLADWDATVAPAVDAFAASGLGRIVFASPFLPTVPGTDTYTDELW